MPKVLTVLNQKQVANQIFQIREAYPGAFKFFILVFHLVGIVGMSLEVSRPYFQLLTPYHLLLSLSFLLFFQKEWNFQFILFAILAFSIGFGSEVMGVHTGFPFGNYAYGPVLGLQLLEVPLLIGINWLLLVYMTGELLHGRIRNDLLASALGAIFMVGIDFLIEPVAITLDFWTWENDIIPISNYLGWFGIAFIIHIIYRKLAFEKENKISSFLLACLIVFFALLNVIL